jgi:hypothetical protein
MKRRWLLWLIAANLVALIALAFAYPHLMVSPGPVVSAHAAIASDCFACHAPLRGASAERCVACHSVADIGLRTSKGLPIVKVAAPVTPGDKAITRRSVQKAAFHQALTDQNCMACHSDHAGPKLTQHSRKHFSHDLLQADTRQRCEACHTAPQTALHRNQSTGCAQCHQAEAWKPATFDHDKLFLLDGDHNATCVTCHVGEDYSRYTCYGCHEHTPNNIRRKHEEEGITKFENCVECHRSADEEPRGGEGRGRD